MIVRTEPSMQLASRVGLLVARPQLVQVLCSGSGRQQFTTGNIIQHRHGNIVELIPSQVGTMLIKNDDSQSGELAFRQLQAEFTLKLHA